MPTVVPTGFYSAAEVARLARVPRRTLSYWQQHGIIYPSVATAAGEDGYSHADLTIIRLLRAIREKRIDFRSASIALRHLYERLGPPSTGWRDARVYLVGGHVYAFLPDAWELTEATRSGQKVEPLFLPDALEGIREEIADLREGDSVVVPSEYREFVTLNPSVRGGDPVVRGTRIPTRVLVALQEAGSSVAQIARIYTSLSRRVIEGVIGYERFLDAQATHSRAITA